MSVIDLPASSANSGAHEALHELPLEEQETERRGAEVISVVAQMIDKSIPGIMP